MTRPSLRAGPVRISAPRRPTQVERRTATIAKLLDATVASLGEVGYANTTVKEISRRAGMSVGGLFRHFSTRLHLLVRAADHVRELQLANFRAGLERLGEASVADSLRLLRAACRAPINAAWYALIAAARTDKRLRDRLARVAVRYHAEIAALGRTLPFTRRLPAADVDAVLFTVVHLFDGEAMSAVVDPRADLLEPRLRLLEAMLMALVGRRVRPAPPGRAPRATRASRARAPLPRAARP